MSPKSPEKPISCRPIENFFPHSFQDIRNNAPKITSNQSFPINLTPIITTFQSTLPNRQIALRSPIPPYATFLFILFSTYLFFCSLHQIHPFTPDTAPPQVPRLTPASRCGGGVKRGTWGGAAPFQRLSLTQLIRSNGPSFGPACHALTQPRVTRRNCIFERFLGQLASWFAVLRNQPMDSQTANPTAASRTTTEPIGGALMLLAGVLDRALVS